MNGWLDELSAVHRNGNVYTIKWHDTDSWSFHLARPPIFVCISFDWVNLFRFERGTARPQEFNERGMNFRLPFTISCCLHSTRFDFDCMLHNPTPRGLNECIGTCKFFSLLNRNGMIRADTPEPYESRAINLWWIWGGQFKVGLNWTATDVWIRVGNNFCFFLVLHL